ncbi:immunoglobulin lambda-like polypeptide 1 [Thunnus maccoyii]|uniref:immunoglobulin lambda-like polypeptide 1 n=1 Tax=Thunnus maccoyii TaxID=8240 RepID=UPI001C4BF087|nr:immunoglobulin lambda-like polypeptide 1 [Thunnus maccoyii]
MVTKTVVISNIYSLNTTDDLSPAVLNSQDYKPSQFTGGSADDAKPPLYGNDFSALNRLKATDFSVDRCLFAVQEVFVRPLNEFVSLWYTFGGGTKLIINSGPTVRPSVSLLPPSSQQLSGGSATLACLLTGYSPQGAVVSWEVDGREVTEGVLSSSEEEKSGRYSSSSILSLSQERWMEGELYSCKVLHQDHSQTQSLHRSQCKG